MYKPFENCFRKDLTVTALSSDKNGKDRRYLLQHPISGETFEFGEEEYFLCQLMDGVTTPERILQKFELNFNTLLTESDFEQFSRQVANLGLLEVTHRDLRKTSSQLSIKQHRELYHWSFFNPTFLFQRLANIVAPFSGILKFFPWLILPGLGIALFTLWNNRFIFYRDTVDLLDLLPFLKRFTFDVFVINFFSKIIQGTVGIYQGGGVREFGITLGFGFLPYFYINKDEFWKLGRQQQLWIFGSPLIYRLLLFIGGVLLWYNTRGTGVRLTVGALTMIHASALSLMVDGNPFWPSDGYGWLINFFRLPATSLSQAFSLLGRKLNRNPLPRFLPFSRAIGLLIYALISISFWGVFFGYGGFLIAAALERNFKGNGVILFLGIFMLFVGWFCWLTAKFGVKANPVSGPEVERLARPKRRNQSSFWKWFRWLLLLGIIVVLLLPYQYHTGGPIVLLPPKKQEIQAQADVEGYVRKVFFKGGDGTWIKAGTVIATLEALAINNNFETVQESIREQQSLLQKAQANVDKLLALPKKEQVDVAQQQVEVAEEDLKVAKGNLETLVVQSEISSRQIDRYDFLYHEGVISLDAAEQVRRQAKTDRTQKETAEQSVKAAQKKLDTAKANLKLVLSGAFPQDIESAKKEVLAIKAKIKRLEHNLAFYKTQLKQTNLLMPFDGTLTTPYLEQKVGIYLKKGDTFAEAENNEQIRGEVLVPEFESSEISKKGQVEAKLLTDPHKSLIGKVLSVAPSATILNDGRFVKVLVEFPKSEHTLKSDMSGYAKIDGKTMPVIVAFSRSLVRFVLIEVWSWFP